MSYSEKYIHLEKLGSIETEGILCGECHIFPKLDGTNGVIWYKDGQVKAGSRNRVLDEHSDNQGFLNEFVRNNHERLKEYFSARPKDILYGEFLKPHTIKTYRDDAWGRFYIFDVRYEGEFLPYSEYSPDLLLREFKVLPPIVIIFDPTEEQLHKCLTENTYLMKDGEIGEGIVIKRYNFKNRYGRTTWAKLVRNEFKDRHRELSNPNKIINRDGIEQVFLNKYLTEDIILKEKAKLTTELGSFENKMIPKFLSVTYYELLRDHLVDFCNKENPTINFKELRTRAFDMIRAFI